MVAEMSPAESLQMSHTDRKRPVQQYGGPSMSTAGTQTEKDVVKRPRQETPQKPSNNGWGDLFKDRQTFVEMHIC